MSFKWSTKEGIINTTHMAYYDRSELRFEALKGVDIGDEIENNGYKWTVKVLKNVEGNNKIIFVNVEKEHEEIRMTCW